MRFRSCGIIAIISVIVGLGLGYKLFNKPEPAPASVKLSDNSQEKKSGTIIKYLPSKCDGKPQEIASVETFDTEVKKDIKSDSKNEESKNALSYIPKYSFSDSKIYHSFSYSYKNYGLYLAENKELGAIFTFRW